MNKIKLLFLFSVFPFLVSAAGNFENKWNKSPIEKVHRYLNNPIISETIVCKKINSVVLANYYFNDYCEVSTEWESDYISLFTTEGALTNANYSATSQPAGSYSDQTTVMITQSAGLSFDIATDYVGGGNGVNIWVDFDDDGVFDNDEKLFSESGSSTHSGTITIPSTVAIGEYRMRVRAQWNATDPPACGQTNYGSTIDFTLVVVDPPACLPVTALNATPLTLTSAELSWTSDGDSFELEWGEAGFTLGSGTLIDNLTTTSTTVTTVIDTPYQFYVRQDCGTDGYSFWAGPFNFKTGYCTPEYLYGCSNGAKVSNFQITNAIINLSNNTGTSECGENGYNNFTAMSASAPAEMQVSFVVGVGSYSAGVKIWVDWNNNGEFETGELMAESATTITSGSTFTGTFLVPAGTSLGDYRMRVRVVEGATSFTACSLQNYGETEDYTFSVIAPPSCMPPYAVNVIQVTDNSIQVGWSAVDGQDLWEILVLPAGSPAPAENATGFVAASENPFTVDGLDPATEYDVYVRANCGTEDGVSLWASPVTTTTTQIAAAVDFTDDFEGDTGWTFTNETQVNKWHIGTATAFAGATSLYISDDEGTSNNYSNSATITHAIRDLSFPAATNEAVISFYWKAVGHVNSFGDNYDMMKVWLMPSSYQPQGNVAITDADGGVQIGEDFLDQEDWVLFQEVYNLGSFAGNTGRLIFEWRNNTFTANQTPAAVDNVSVTLVTCSRPIEVQVQKHQVTNDLIASWTPVAGETQWEVIVQESTDPAPDDTAVGVIVNQPQYTIPNVVQGVFYKVYVRAVCSDDDKSLWTEGVDFSDFNPPACARIDLTPLDLNLNEQGEYVICEGEDHVINLEAAFDASKFKSTESYEVESIDYTPPFPFIGGVEMNVAIDDTWSPVINLPFDVCFYGNNFSTAQVGSNGMVSFGTDHCQTAGCAPWAIGDITFPSSTYDDRLQNVIMGVYQDIYPGVTQSPNGSINYQVLGTYPCRALVVNFKDINQFNCLATTGPQTSQIVIYEITNIIEVYVERRVPCNSHNSGRGAIGLINGDGTQATIPPGRNVGNWTTEQEAWRFSPSGVTDVTFGWYMDGELISNDPSHQVTINESKTFEARVTYPGCTGGDDLVLSRSFTVKVSEEIELGDPDDLIFCTDNMEDEDRPRITDNYEEIMSLITNKNEFIVTYHTALEDAEEGTNPIADPENYIPDNFPETIYVRVMSLETECYEVVSFDVIEGEKPLELTQEDVIICNKYALPALGAGQEYMYYDYVNFGTGVTTRVEKPAVGAMLAPGDYTVHVLSTSKDGCYEEFSFQIKVFPCIIPKGISPNGDGDNDYLDLADYMVQDIKIFNRYGKEVYSHGVGYKREWKGQDNNGNLLPTGTYYYNIITPFEQFTGYIYIMREVK